MGTVQHLPRQIGIELVRGGNFSCQMCPVTVNAPGEMERFQFLTLPLLERLVSEIDRCPSIETIWFFQSGEPLAHPEYRKCLEILATSRVASRAMVVQHTNGSLLRGEKAEAILDSQVIKKLVFSFDEFGDKGSFEIMRGPHFDRVSQDIRDFTAAARSRRPDLLLATRTISPRPGELPIVEMPPREVALRRLHELFDPLGVTVETRDMPNDSNNGDLPIAGRMPARVFGGCQFVEDDSLYFTVNGWAQPCCAVYSEQFQIGHLAHADFGDLLNGEPMRRLRRSLRLDRRHEVPHCNNCKLSLGGALGPGELQAFWKARDDRGMIDDGEERRYLFEVVAPTPHRQLRVDLGCGRVKLPGFIGVDRSPLPGVDIVADLDEPLPFADDSIDLVYASHSLEHVRDLSKVIREIYRFCKHGAQVCIVAPYYQQGLNLANLYHKQPFNEHTPRFWTVAATTPVDPAEYHHPHAVNWGLLDSDNSEVDIDIRCANMEFFYFPEYRDLPPHDQRRHRRRELDVCDQVVYHLVVLKRPVTDEGFFKMAQAMDRFESPFITIRRLQEQYERLEANHHQSMEHCRKLEADYREVSRFKERLEADFQEVWRIKVRLEADLPEVLRYKERLEADLQEVLRNKERLEADLQEVLRYKERLEADYHEVARHKERLEADYQEVSRSNVTLALEASQRNRDLEHFRQRSDDLSRANTALQETISCLQQSISAQERLLATITSGTGWQSLHALRRARSALAPSDTLRGRAVEAVWALPRWIVRRSLLATMPAARQRQAS